MPGSQTVHPSIPLKVRLHKSLFNTWTNALGKRFADVTRRQADDKACIVCKEKAFDPTVNPMFYCDGCDDGVHLCCCKVNNECFLLARACMLPSTCVLLVSTLIHFFNMQQQEGEVPLDQVNDPFFCTTCRGKDKHMWVAVPHTFRDETYDKMHPLDGEIATAEAKLTSFAERQAAALVDGYPQVKK